MTPMRVHVQYSRGLPDLVQGDHAVHHLWTVDRIELTATTPEDERAEEDARWAKARRLQAGEPLTPELLWSHVRHHKRETYRVTMRGTNGVVHGQLLRTQPGGWWLILDE